MLPRRSSRWPLFVATAALVLAAAACSGDDGDDDASDTAGDPTSSVPAVGSKLVLEGEMTCTDAPADVSVSAETQAPPPVPTPGVDVLDVGATLDDEVFTTTFNLADAPVVESRPEYLILVGYPDDLRGFEIQLHPEDGIWIAELLQRAEVGTNRPQPLVNASVTATEDRVILTVPTDALPPISVSQPVFFGASALLMKDGVPMDRADLTSTTTTAPTGTGSTTTTTAMVAPSGDVRAIDDCTQFGQ